MAVLFDESGAYVGPKDVNDPLLDVTKAPPGRGSEVLRARNAAVEAMTPKSTAEEIEPSPVVRGLAAFGGALAEPLHGLVEKAQLAFPGKGQSGVTAQRIGDERSQRREAQRELEETPAGMAGGLAGKGVPYMAAQSPAALAAIAAGTGFLQGGPDRPSGLLQELGTSGAQAAADAATAYVPAKGLQLAGKAVGAATGAATSEGARAKEVEAAAARLGLPRPSFGQVYPESWVADYQRANGAHNALVKEQAEALYEAITKQTPYGVDDVGGKYLDELRQAVGNRYSEGSKLYKAVDDIVTQLNLPPLRPIYSANVVTNTKNPGYQVAATEMSKYGFDITTQRGYSAAQIGKVPISFDDYSTVRAAVGKATGNITRQIENVKNSSGAVPLELREARSFLGQLRTALDNDAERWARQNSGNREAVNAFKKATDYWREQVVPTVIENPFARKLSSPRRGFPTGERATSLSLSNANIPLVDRLVPTMSDRGADMTEILRTLPEVRARALTGEASQMPRGPLHAFGQLAEGRRDISTLEKLSANIPVLSPLVRGTANSTPVRRLYGAKDVLTGQLPQRLPAYGLAVPWGSNMLQEYGKDRLKDHGE